jgi:uncharacterized membrane protein YphA (DoxX/SURF4 family)
LGLLLLRAAVGITAGVQGIVYLVDNDRQSLWVWGIGFLAIVSGVFLLIGFLTSVTSVLIGLGSLSGTLFRFPIPTTNFFDIKLAVFFMVVMAAAIFLLGPGAFSIDARLFGRREIVILRTPRSPDS